MCKTEVWVEIWFYNNWVNLLNGILKYWKKIDILGVFHT